MSTLSRRILSLCINRQVAEKLQEKKSPCTKEALYEAQAIGDADDLSDQKHKKREESGQSWLPSSSSTRVEVLLCSLRETTFSSFKKSDYGPDEIARVVVLAYVPILVPPGMKTLMVGVTVYVPAPVPVAAPKNGTAVGAVVAAGIGDNCRYIIGQGRIGTGCSNGTGCSRARNARGIQRQRCRGGGAGKLR